MARFCYQSKAPGSTFRKWRNLTGIPTANKLEKDTRWQRYWSDCAKKYSICRPRLSQSATPVRTVKFSGPLHPSPLFAIDSTVGRRRLQGRRSRGLAVECPREITEILETEPVSGSGMPVQYPDERVGRAPPPNIRNRWLPSQRGRLGTLDTAAPDVVVHHT